MPRITQILNSRNMEELCKFVKIKVKNTNTTTVSIKAKELDYHTIMAIIHSYSSAIKYNDKTKKFEFK